MHGLSLAAKDAKENVRPSVADDARLTIGSDVILPRGYPNAERMLDRAGLRVHPLHMSEFQKRDGGVTCLSLLYTQSAPRRV